MQTDAMRFVADMADTFGARLMDMHFRPQDGCAAFEHFLHTGRFGQAQRWKTLFWKVRRAAT